MCCPFVIVIGIKIEKGRQCRGGMPLLLFLRDLRLFCAIYGVFLIFLHMKSSAVRKIPCLRCFSDGLIDVRESDFAQGVDAVAAVHIGDFAGDAGGEVGQQEGGGVADFFDGYVAAERVLVGDVFEQFAKIGDA